MPMKHAAAVDAAAAAAVAAVVAVAAAAAGAAAAAAGQPWSLKYCLRIWPPREIITVLQFHSGIQIPLLWLMLADKMLSFLQQIMEIEKE